MTNSKIYKPEYKDSWALIIGIDAYPFSPLNHAVNDARAVGEILTDKFSFPQENVKWLINDDATRDNIMQSFLSYATNPKIDDNDRIVVFFAGHGTTKSGNRGETGYLVPVNGDIDNLASLVRWDELTRNCDLIPAKHILFIMDACYGGLAAHRYLSPGSKRLMTDMLRRYTRQVLTAGKADEVVADGGGPRPGHSMFTGHLLEAMDGKAASADGILTANLIMAYVYDRVAKDQYSNQTPHYGFLDGDGDFIFNFPKPNVQISEEKGEDILIGVPAAFAEQAEPPASPTAIELTKEYLSDDKFKIKLDDLVASKLRIALPQIGEVGVANVPIDINSIVERLKRYETLVGDLQPILALIGKWGGRNQHQIFHKMFSHLTDNVKPTGGLVVWLGLRWYPALLLTYCAGISALEAKNYQNLYALFTATVPSTEFRNKSDPIIISVVNGILEAQNIFKMIPGFEKRYAPRSEYIFTVLQPVLDDLLFLGSSYDQLYDQFEIFFALSYADLSAKENGTRFWGPPGRFAWKYARGSGINQFTAIRAEARLHKAQWAPLKAGFFNGSFERFEEVADGFEALMKGLNWW